VMKASSMKLQVQPAMPIVENCASRLLIMVLLWQVAPILSIGSASLVAISTLTCEINFYTYLIKMVAPPPGARSTRRGASSSHARRARRTARRTSACTCCISLRRGRARSGTAS